MFPIIIKAICSITRLQQLFPLDQRILEKSKIPGLMQKCRGPTGSQTHGGQSKQFLRTPRLLFPIEQLVVTVPEDVNGEPFICFGVNQL